MNLLQARRAIRMLLRDDTYPLEDIDLAIESVLSDINVLHRFRFHEATYSFNLTANNSSYSVPTGVIAEKVFVYALGNNSYEKEIPKRREPWASSPIQPSSTGSSPSEWWRYGDNWYINPIPDDTMVTNGNVTVFYDKDLTMPVSPMNNFTLPNRHRNVLIYGAVANLRPNLIIGSPEGDARAETLYNRTLKSLLDQELWDYAKIPAMRTGPRWDSQNDWGHVSRIR